MYYYDEIGWKNWRFYVVASQKGLVSISVSRTLVETYHAEKNEDILRVYTQQLIAYLEGKRHDFSVQLDIAGTSFQKDVWHVLKTIRHGEVVTYSDVAKKIGRPNSVRAVGGAIGKNPLLLVIPCHRVIGKNGTLTGFSSGLDLKKTLLHHENVIF